MYCASFRGSCWCLLLCCRLLSHFTAYFWSYLLHYSFGFLSYMLAMKRSYTRASLTYYMYQSERNLKGRCKLQSSAGMLRCQDMISHVATSSLLWWGPTSSTWLSSSSIIIRLCLHYKWVVFRALTIVYQFSFIISLADNNGSTTWRLPHSPLPKRGFNPFFNHSLLPKSTAHHRSTPLIPPAHRSRSRHFHDRPFETRSSNLRDLTQPFPRLRWENGLHPHTIQYHRRIRSILQHKMVPLPSSATSGPKETERKGRRWELGNREGKRDEVSGI